MTRVKICGLTRREDALAAVEAGADALGFVFAPGSPRRVDVETVAVITSHIGPFVTLVGVFADQSGAEIRTLMRSCRLHIAQVHGQTDPHELVREGIPVLRAVPVRCREDVTGLPSSGPPQAVLFDTARAGVHGGTGTSFDWSWLAGVPRHLRVVLAGGLHPGNVAAAIRSAAPWAVDVCSGVESSPGVKDHQKLQAFVAAARGAV